MQDQAVILLIMMKIKLSIVRQKELLQPIGVGAALLLAKSLWNGVLLKMD